MADLELIRDAIYFAMEQLCDGYLDSPSGCHGCPLYDWDKLDEDANINCRGDMFRAFIERHGLDGADDGK